MRGPEAQRSLISTNMCYSWRMCACPELHPTCPIHQYIDKFSRDSTSIARAPTRFLSDPLSLLPLLDSAGARFALNLLRDRRSAIAPGSSKRMKDQGVINWLLALVGKDKSFARRKASSGRNRRELVPMSPTTIMRGKLELIDTCQA